MFELVRIAIAVIGSSIAGLWDLKTTDIPDALVIAMIILGFSINFYEGFLTGDFSLFIDSLVFGGIFFVFSFAMYYFGQWGGGDGELLIAIGVLLPTLPSTFSKTLLPFSISFFINSIFIGAIYSIIYAIILIYRNRGMKTKIVKELKDTKIIMIIIGNLFLSVIFAFIQAFMLSFIFILITVLYLFRKSSKTFEMKFYKKIPISKLRVGDMIGEDISQLKIYRKFLRGLTKER